MKGIHRKELPGSLALPNYGGTSELILVVGVQSIEHTSTPPVPCTAEAEPVCTS